VNLIVYNSAIAIVEIIYTFFIIGVTNVAVKRKRMSQDMSRKIVHLWAGGLLFFWFFYAAPYARYFFIITPLIWMVMLVLTALTKGPDDPNVRSMTRNSDPKELLYGPLFFVIMLILFTFVSFKTIAGVTAIAAMGFGDGVAPIVGKYSKTKYMKGRKSIGGSVSVFLATVLGVFVILALFNGTISFTLNTTGVLLLLAAALIATIVEAVTPSNYDNITVPVVVWMFLLLAA